MRRKKTKKQDKYNKNDNAQNVRKGVQNNNKVWTSRLKEIGNIIGSLVTIAASIATCITVLEMRNERNQAYKPYFIIEKAVYDQNFEKPGFNIYDTNNLVHTLLMKTDDFIPITLIIDNIGSGTATNIRVVYSCEEFKDYWRIVSSYYDDKIEVTDNQFRVKYYLSSFGVNEYKHSMNTTDTTIDKPYVFSGEKMEIPIPEEYRRLFYSIAYCMNGDHPELPEINIEIYYDDLQGITYHKAFKLGINIQVDIKSDSKLNYVKYIIEQSE